MNMGERIKQLRIENGLTQEELGKYIGVQKSAIRKYEKGEVKNMKRSSIQILSNLFKVSPSYLMCLDEDITNNSPSSIPLLSDYSNSLDFSIENFFIKNININNNITKETFALKTNDESMSPALGLGDIAIVEKTDTFKDEQVCLISLDDNTMIRIIKDYKSYIELQALNYHFEAIKLTKEDMKKRNFKVIGKVIRAENESFFK